MKCLIFCRKTSRSIFSSPQSNWPERKSNQSPELLHGRGYCFNDKKKQTNHRCFVYKKICRVLSVQKWKWEKTKPPLWGVYISPLKIYKQAACGCSARIYNSPSHKRTQKKNINECLPHRHNQTRASEHPLGGNEAVRWFAASVKSYIIRWRVKSGFAVPEKVFLKIKKKKRIIK